MMPGFRQVAGKIRRFDSGVLDQFRRPKLTPPVL
jgi:hypothetical protein